MIYRRRHTEWKTEDLTDVEATVMADLIVALLLGRTSWKNAISAAAIAKQLRAAGVETTTPRVRKIINYGRLTGQLRNLIETSRGYHYARTARELQTYVNQINAQQRAMYAVTKALLNNSDLTGVQKPCL